MSDFIFNFIIAILVTFILLYLNKKTGKEIIPDEQGEYRLRLHKFYWYLGIGTLILGVVAFIMIGNFSKEENKWAIGLIFLLLFGGTGTISALMYKNYHLNFTDGYVKSTSITGKTNTLQWKTISAVGLNPFTGMLIFKNPKGIQVKAHMHLVGINKLLTTMEQKTSWKKKDFKLPFQ